MAPSVLLSTCCAAQLQTCLVVPFLVCKKKDLGRTWSQTPGHRFWQMRAVIKLMHLFVGAARVYASHKRICGRLSPGLSFLFPLNRCAPPCRNFDLEFSVIAEMLVINKNGCGVRSAKAHALDGVAHASFASAAFQGDRQELRCNQRVEL